MGVSIGHGKAHTAGLQRSHGMRRAKRINLTFQAYPANIFKPSKSGGRGGSSGARMQATLRLAHRKPAVYEQKGYSITCAYVLDRLEEECWVGKWYLLVLSLVLRRPLARWW